MGALVTDLALWLSGLSFAIAVLAAVIAIAEHYRAERAEAALCLKQSDTINVVSGVAGNVTRVIAALDQAATRINQQEAMIRAVAAASTPPAIPVGQVHIVVPGPRTAQ